MTWKLIPLALAVLLSTAKLNAQAEPAGLGPGSYVSLGFTTSGLQSDYGKQNLLGSAVYLDANLYRRVGVEAEYRGLQFHNQESLRQTTFLVGPRFSSHAHKWRPYAKLLAGRGTMDFPFGYARGSYFVVAPGGGLDVRLGHSRLMVRAVDFEYQMWQNFTFGPMHPYGLSTGVSFRVF